MTTTSPNFISAYSIPWSTWQSAQFTGGIASSGSTSGTSIVTVIAPVVQIGAADGGRGVLDENAPRLDLRGGERFQLERSSRLHQHGGQSLGHGDTSCV